MIWTAKCGAGRKSEATAQVSISHVLYWAIYKSFFLRFLNNCKVKKGKELGKTSILITTLKWFLFFFFGSDQDNMDHLALAKNGTEWLARVQVTSVQFDFRNSKIGAYGNSTWVSLIILQSTDQKFTLKVVTFR